MTRRSSPAAVWSFGLGSFGAAVTAASVVLGSRPGNPAVVLGVTVVLAVTGLGGAVAAGLGAAALRQPSRDRPPLERPLAFVGLVLGVLLALPVPWFTASASGLALGSSLTFLLGMALAAAGLFALAYVVYRRQAGGVTDR